MSYFCLSDSVLTDNQRCKFYFEHQVFLTQSLRQNCVESVQIGDFLVSIFPFLERRQKFTLHISVFSRNTENNDQNKLYIWIFLGSPIYCFSLCEKYLYLEFFGSVISHIWIGYGKILRIFPYSVQMREKVDQKNSEYGQFSCSVCCWLSIYSWSLFLCKSNEILSCRGHTGKWMLTLSCCPIKGHTYLNKPAAFSPRFV